MVGRDVEERCGVRLERRREIDLEGRQLQHISEIVGEGLEIEHRRADIAAERHALARALNRCAVSAVVVDLPLVPVMTTTLALVLGLRPRAEEQLDVADDLDAGGRAPSPRSNGARDGSAECPAPAPARRMTSKSADARSATVSPAAAASARAASLSSHTTTVAPPLSSARAVARPLSPRPTTATSQPAKIVTGIMMIGT